EHRARRKIPELFDRHVIVVLALAKLLPPDLLRNADDRHARRRVRAEPNAFAHRVLSRPQPVAHALADDDDPRRIEAVTGREAAAAQNSRAKRRKEIGASSLQREIAERVDGVDSLDE